METPAPLDLLFFTRPDNDPVTAIIQHASAYRFGKVPHDWSHVGIVIDRRFMPSLVDSDPNAPPDTLYLWESTLSSPAGIYTAVERIADVTTGRYRFGVQIRRLDTILAACKDAGVGVGLSKMNVIMRESLTETESAFAATQAILDISHNDFTNVRYETNPLRLTCAFCQQCKNKKPVRLFSSQFVTMVYQRLGVFPNTINSAYMLPVELAYPKVSDDDDYIDTCAGRFDEPLILIAAGDDKSTSGVIRRLLTRALQKGAAVAIKLLVREAEKALRKI